MKNLKVSVKLGLIIVSVIIMVIVASSMSVNDMNQVQDKALETMESSSRQSYDDLIKQQVGVAISLLSDINDEYKAGKYTLEEAKTLAADEIRQLRYGDAGYFWIDQSDGTNQQGTTDQSNGTGQQGTTDQSIGAGQHSTIDQAADPALTQ